MAYKKSGNTGSKAKFLVPIALVGLVVLLVILELSGITNFIKKDVGQNPQQPTETINYTPTSEQEQAQIDADKTDPAKIPDKNTNPSPTTSSLASIISAKQEANEVVVKTELEGSGWQSCKLTLTRNSDTVNKTAEVIYQEQFSTCAGFSTPTSEFAQSGTWSAKLFATRIDRSTVESEAVNVSVTK